MPSPTGRGWRIAPGEGEKFRLDRIVELPDPQYTCLDQSLNQTFSLPMPLKESFEVGIEFPSGGVTGIRLGKVDDGLARFIVFLARSDFRLLMYGLPRLGEISGQSLQIFFPHFLQQGFFLLLFLFLLPLPDFTDRPVPSVPRDPQPSGLALHFRPRLYCPVENRTGSSPPVRPPVPGRS